MDQDREHLQLLSIFHYVVGGMTGLVACFPLIHLALGIAMLSGTMPQTGHQGPPPFFGWIFVAAGSFLFFLGWTMAIAIFCAGRFLAQHTHYLYCLVIAGIECLFMPLGTILGVFTIVVLMRPSVKALFEGAGND